MFPWTMGTHHAFDIDIYDCPCGHMYGDHDYRWSSPGVIDPEEVMLIDGCNKCPAVRGKQQEGNEGT